MTVTASSVMGLYTAARPEFLERMTSLVDRTLSDVKQVRSPYRLVARPNKIGYWFVCEERPTIGDREALCRQYLDAGWPVAEFHEPIGEKGSWEFRLWMDDPEAVTA